MWSIKVTANMSHERGGTPLVSLPKERRDCDVLETLKRPFSRDWPTKAQLELGYDPVAFNKARSYLLIYFPAPFAFTSAPLLCMFFKVMSLSSFRGCFFFLVYLSAFW